MYEICLSIICEICVGICKRMFRYICEICLSIYVKRCLGICEKMYTGGIRYEKRPIKLNYIHDRRLF